MAALFRISLLMLLLCVSTAVGHWPGLQLKHTGTYTWVTEAVVGLSGLEVEDDGQTFHAIGDRGWYLSGGLERTDGAISGIALVQYLPILGTDGLPVSARRVGDWSDAEGLVVADNGDIWISFERWARVVRYEGPGDSGTVSKPHPTFIDYPNNRQLEALALHPDGTLYAFAEAPQAEGFAVYRMRNGEWEITGHIARQNWYAIVGADFDAQGRLYLLERRNLFGTWWQSRIRGLDIAQPDVVTPLWTSRMGAFDNLEGIAVWRDGAETRVTVVSDNNGTKAARTQFLEFVLTMP